MLFRSQYEQLLTDILISRSNGDFHAADYFSLIPPVGTVPKDAIDPMSGRQGYFPENYQVAIAPIRQSDVELIIAESLNLPPIDLSNGEPVDVVVLVPLTNLDYGHYAAQLERNIDPTNRRLPRIDLLKLKLYPVRPVHSLDTDLHAWTNIWNRVGDTPPFYVRRPTRAAETAISGIVLALGASVPAPPVETDAPGGSPADSGGLIQDENALFLERISLRTLAELRPPRDSEANDAFDKLLGNFGEDALVVQQCASILMRIERLYDSLIWQTLLALADGRLLAEFLRGLRTANADAVTPRVVASLGRDLGLDANLLNQWARLVP